MSDARLEFLLPPGLAGSAHVDVETSHGSDRPTGGLRYFGHPPTFAPAGSRIETDPPGASESWHPRTCCDGQTVHVVWADTRNGAGDVHCRRSTAAGPSWLPRDVRLDTDAPGTGESWDPVVCCNGPYVYVSWEDERDGAEDTWGNASGDGGQRWLAANRRLDADAPGSASPHHVRLVCDGPNAFVGWHDTRGPGPGTLVHTTPAHGLTWLASDIRISAAGASIYGEGLGLARTGAQRYAVWIANPLGTELDLHFKASSP